MTQITKEERFAIDADELYEIIQGVVQQRIYAQVLHITDLDTEDQRSRYLLDVDLLGDSVFDPTDVKNVAVTAEEFYIFEERAEAIAAFAALADRKL